MDVINPAIAAVETESLLHIFKKQRKSVLTPRCVSFTQSDADKLPVSNFYQSFSGVLVSRFRVSPSPPFAGSFAGSCNLVLHNSLMHKHRSWRRGSESNEVFTDCQPQYPDLQGYFNADFTEVQEVFNTIRQLPDLTRHLPVSYSVIEEIVEDFVEGFLTGLEPFAGGSSQGLRRSNHRIGHSCAAQIAYAASIISSPMAKWPHIGCHPLLRLTKVKKRLKLSHVI